MLDYILAGISQLSAWQCVIYTLIVTHITIAGVTLYLHRSQAHRAVEFHPIISHFFRFWLWLTTGMVTKEWVAVHRKHHVYSEQPDDPHSPLNEGVKNILCRGVEYYRKATSDKVAMERYGRGTPDDWVERNIYTKYSAKGVVLLLILNMILFGVHGVTIWAVQMLWIPFFAAGVINGLAHYFGYRNFETPDTATNLMPIGILIGGEELHNNHHAYGSSAKFSQKWYEFDIGWFYITIMKAVGLAKVLKVAPKLQVNPSKNQLDVESVGAILTNRLQVMDRYLQKVIKPVFREVKGRTDEQEKLTVLMKAKRLLARDDNSLIGPADKQQLKTLLEQFPSLEKVFAFRQSLQDIWHKTTMSQKELLESLQAWCREAEASGVKVLIDFAESIKTYSNKPVSL